MSSIVITPQIRNVQEWTILLFRSLLNYNISGRSTDQFPWTSHDSCGAKFSLGTRPLLRMVVLGRSAFFQGSAQYVMLQVKYYNTAVSISSLSLSLLSVFISSLRLFLPHIHTEPETSSMPS